MRHYHLSVVIALGVSAILAGCTTTQTRPPLYCNDSSYTEAMYLYLQDEPDLAKQKELMNKYFESVQANNQKPAPGAYAQMGQLSAKDNDPVAAEKYFAMEKEAFPESAKYFDFLTKKRATKQGGQQ